MKYYFPLIALMVLHAVFLLIDAYAILHIDSAMHLVGGISLGMFVLGSLENAVRRGWCPNLGKTVASVMVISLVMTGAVCWEFYEWASDIFLGTHLQPSLNDTVKDLFLGLSGAVLFISFINYANSDRPLFCRINNEGSAVRSEK